MTSVFNNNLSVKNEVSTASKPSFLCVFLERNTFLIYFVFMNILTPLIVVVVIIAAGIYMIPSQTYFTKSITFSAPIEKVWDVYNDYGSQAAWRPEIEKIEMGDDGQSWSEHLRQGGIVIEFEVREKIEQQKMVLDIAHPGVFVGEYIAIFEKINEDTTKGTFTESATSLSIPAKIMRFIFVNPEKLIDKYAEDALKEIQKRG